MEITIPKGVDMHVHLRQDEVLATTVPATAKQFSQALVMPNTKPAIVTQQDMLGYAERIMDHAHGYDFKPHMTFKIYPDMDPSSIFKAPAMAGKVYPRGLTTNAEDGVQDYFALYDIFARMESQGLVLCLHGEKPGEDIDGLEREREFLRTLTYIARTFPKLRIVMEHITTAAAVEKVLELPSNVAATITVHHLLLTYDDVSVDRMRPHHYCKPVAKTRSDRDALIEAAISGCPKFFFGSDSAPHPPDSKICDDCCAGIFTAPVVMPLLAHIFEQHNALERLRIFTHDAAVRFYRLRSLISKLTLIKEPMRVPPMIDGFVPFCAGQELQWSVKE